MKRYGNLYETICSWDNLLLASRKAQKGKRLKPNVARFNFRLEEELLNLHDELLNQTYRPGDYHHFTIYEEKKRLISAAPYRDRVVHHALCNVIEPIFERTFIYDSYACRKGKGTHAAAARAQQFCRRYGYALKCDVQQYFPSIDHEILFALLARKIKCPQTLWLIETIITSGGADALFQTGNATGLSHISSLEEGVSPALLQRNGAAEGNGTESVPYFAGDDLFTPHGRRRGIPIGNQTSQFFANVYLNGFDHWVLDAHKGRGYVRYVDDFILFDDSKERLHDFKRAAEDYLVTLRLRLHPNKSQVFPVRDGVTFVGYRLFRGHSRLRADNPRRCGRRLREKAVAWARGKTTFSDINRSVQSWLGHARHADSTRLRRDLFAGVVFRRGSAA